MINPEEIGTLIEQANPEPTPAASTTRKTKSQSAPEAVDEEKPVEITLTKAEYEEAARWEHKIKKLNRLFPSLNLTEDERFHQIAGQHPETLEKLYNEWYAILEEQNSKPMTMVAYETISQIVEVFLTDKLDIDVSGMTAQNIRDPTIIRQLKLLELEYDLGDVIPVSDPTLALCISTLTGALMCYKINKKEKAVKELENANSPSE